MKALIIDDSRTTRFILSRMLRELGYETVEAEHGEQGITRLHENPDIKLALVDWNMPVMSGLEFLKTLREGVQHQHLKVLMVTTETEMSQVIRAVEAGANEYVMKPFTKEMVLEKLQLLGITPQE